MLTDAVIDIARQQGIEALTTARVANAAGVTQPAFYVHFKNLDHCLQVTAELLFERLVELQDEARRQAGSLISGRDALDGREVIAAIHERILELALSERRLTEVALRYRYDSSSAIGRSVSRALDRARLQLAADLRQAARRTAPADRLLQRCELLADLLLWLLLGALEALFKGRYPDREALVGSLAGATRSLIISATEEGSEERPQPDAEV